MRPSVPEHATLPRTAARWPCHKVPSGLPNARPMLDAVADHWQPIALHNTQACLHKRSGFPHWVLCCDSAARGCTPHFVRANCDRTLVCSAQCPWRSIHRACVLIALCSSNSPMRCLHCIYQNTVVLEQTRGWIVSLSTQARSCVVETSYDTVGRYCVAGTSCDALVQYCVVGISQGTVLQPQCCNHKPTTQWFQHNCVPVFGIQHCRFYRLFLLR